ncbi:MAG: LamG domain-containing protein, partial [Sedimentisphaerales bacterium]|nr:LamG domain-containing protein [Sedimentisphaerales bacterium]
SNGSWMGRSSPPYLQVINHSGGHSAPMEYHNVSKSYSEVKADTSKLLNGSDWSIGHPGALVIWFMSDANDVNDPITDQLYVKLNNANKKVYGDSSLFLRRAAWTRWEIPLTGIPLSNITSITIGVEKVGSTGGEGTLYFDDIMLTSLSPDPIDPGTDNLVAMYEMENNAQDSSGNSRNGTLIGPVNGVPVFDEGLGSYGTAIVMDGNDDCIDLGKLEAFNFEGSFSISLWAKIADWSSAWGHDMISNRGESVGWQIRRAGGAGGTRLCFTTRGLSNEDMFSNATSPAINEWTNITCVYDSEAHTKSIYIDGVLDNTVELTGDVTKVKATTHNTYIGARANSGNTARENFFTGMLDQVLIYDDSLSAAEALYLANPNP